MGLPTRQRSLEANTQKGAHVARLAEEKRRTDQQAELHAVRVPELETRKHGQGAPRRSLGKRRAGPEVRGALDREIDTDLALARLGAQICERQETRVPAQRHPEDEAAGAAENRALIDERAEPRAERCHAQRSGAQGARIADIRGFDLPPAAQRPRETSRPRAARPACSSKPSSCPPMKRKAGRPGPRSRSPSTPTATSPP